MPGACMVEARLHSDTPGTTFRLSQDTSVDKPCQFITRQTQQAPKDLLVRLAEPTYRSRLPWCAMQTYGQARVFHAAGGWMCQRHNRVSRPQMHIAPQILASLHSTGWHTGILQETHGLVWGTLAGPGSNEGIQRVVLEPALSRYRKAPIVRQRAITDEPGEGTPVCICGAAYDAPGIIPQAGIAALRHIVWIAIAAGSRDGASGEVVEEGHLHSCGGGFYLGNLDVLPLAGAGAMVQGSGDGERTRPRGSIVRIGDLTVGIERGIRMPPEEGHASVGHQRATVADKGTVWTALSEAGHTHHNQVGTHRAQMLVVQLVLYHDTWAKILHHHITERDQAFEQLPPLRHLKIQGDGAFVAINLREGCVVGAATIREFT